MKIRFSLLPAILLSLAFALGACAPDKTSDKNQPPDPPSGQQTSPPDGQPTDPPEKPQETPTGLWDTADIDISHIRSKRLIAFTFDDGPKTETAALLDVFAQFNEDNPDWQAHATLFTLGGNVNDSNKQLLQRAVNEGMELGNHSFSHPNLTTLNDEEILEETGSTDKLLEEIDGKEKHLLRPPGGHYDDHLLSLIGVPLINWTGSLDTSDWSGVSENDIYNKVSSNLIDGGVVLMHQGYVNTVNAVKRLLPDLKERGFQVVSVSELAKAYGIDLYAGKAYSYLG